MEREKLLSKICYWMNYNNTRFEEFVWGDTPIGRKVKRFDITADDFVNISWDDERVSYVLADTREWR